MKSKVLVIDDERGLRELLSFELGSRGYEVGTAADGAEGLRLAREGRFDVVISDVTMPRMNGIETLGALKELDPKLEVIMVTGYASLETAVQSMKRGAYDYITKPFQVEDLLRLVERALEKRRLHLRVDELQELNRLKSEFLANMSHELRTPMNAIIGYTSLLLDRVYGQIPDKQEQALKRVELNARNLLQLINNILDFSKLAAGRMPVSLETFELGALAQEVIDTVESLAREKSLDLRVESPQGGVSLRSDRTKIKQILVNLMGNSIKFTQKGGVTVRVEAAPEGKVRFSVKDTGIGIKPEDVPLLFQEFRQVDASPTREYGGTGLGLSICKKLSELLGGEIRVESVYGQGTAFIVTLPVGEAAPQAVVAPAAPEGLPAAARGRVLLAIDDDPEVLNLLKDSLKDTGITFVGAQGGDEGLALARTIHPFCITLDIMMPHKDGWTVLQLLKNDPALRHIPVIIISIMENKTLGFSLGVSDYIVKPFDRQLLLDTLRRLESKSGPQGRLKILLADDDKSISELFKEALRNEGYDVETASNGRAAFERLAQWRPDALFLDLMMPEMSGFEILESMGKDPELRQTRVFILTAKHLTPKEAQYLQERVAMIVQKGSKSLKEILSGMRENLKGLKGGG